MSRENLERRLPYMTGKKCLDFFHPSPLYLLFLRNFWYYCPHSPPLRGRHVLKHPKGFPKRGKRYICFETAFPWHGSRTFCSATTIKVAEKHSDQNVNCRQRFSPHANKKLAIDSYCVSYGEGLFTLNYVKWQPPERRWWPNFHTVPRPSKCSSPEMYKMTKQN